MAEPSGKARISARELFIKALSMKVHHVPAAEIRLTLIQRASESGNRVVHEKEDATGYLLTFASGEKIRFDGTDYHYQRS